MEVQPLSFGFSPRTSPDHLLSQLEFTRLHDLSTSSLKGAKKLQSDDDFQLCYLHPRFVGEQLQKLLQDHVVRGRQNRVLDMPIEYYESLLYNCTKTYVDTLAGAPVSLDCLSDIHQIYSLKQSEPSLNAAEQMQVNNSLELLLEEKPTVFEEYKLIKGLNELVCGLIIHFGLYSRQKYEYRWNARVTNVRTLDLSVLNCRLQSMDTLWLAKVANRSPMSTLISETTKQLAVVLVCATEALFKFALKMNATDFRTQPSIDRFLVRKSPRLQNILHVECDYVVPPPTYQELSLPTSFFAKCFKTRSQKNLERLRELLSGQEFAFRAFEEAVLANFVV